MDADEKLKALKKAYADIILNISKEAAGRVTASEGKAVRYKHELKVAKEEGLRMLTRLKQMMDSKVHKAEAASVNQHKKIEELEAQLNEAEDIVRDLREEVTVVLDELERVKNDNMRLINEVDAPFSQKIAVENPIYSYQSSTSPPPKSLDESAIASDATIPYLCKTNSCSKCHNGTTCFCHSYIGNTDLPSIILGGVESRLYRKGCSQRIHACERNSLKRNMSLLGEIDKVKGKSLNELENKRLRDVKYRSFNPFLQKRKRTYRKRKIITPLSGRKSDILLKLEHLHELSARNNPRPVEISHSNEEHLRLVSRLPPDKDEQQTSLRCSEYSEKDEAKTDKDNELIEEMLSCKETGVEESLPSLDRKMEVEKVDVASHSLYDTTTGLPSQPNRERVIKITFERKRKRKDFSGSGENVSLRTEERIGDKQNGHQDLELPEPGLVLESLRDGVSNLVLESKVNRQMALVARQLVALSETKWWD
ncbi:uncharacterized protein [Primulina huaijiensis]|uniref:uncharacterized protein n=1 Tax=Primulina huaijiensis TaxID=1492673 RepID=UPI003CC71813